MDIKINKSEIDGRVSVPPSKSIAHRAMIACALSGNAFSPADGGDDVRATSKCLESLTPFINNSLRGDSHSVEFSSGDCTVQDAVKLHVGESGSTLRFLLPVVCALGIKCVFDGEGRLKDRPIDGLLKTLGAHGASFRRPEGQSLPLFTEGKLAAGEYRIAGNVSSQYITGLLFALPLLEEDSVLKIDGGIVSKGYIDITLGVLNDFGITIKKISDGYFVKGGQRYIMPSDLKVEGDWSSAGFMLALGALAGEVRVSGLYKNTLQGDGIIAELLKRAGADIEWVGADIVARRSSLTAIDFDAQDCPDVVPIMATALSFAKGASHIRSVDRLKDKECDRLAATRKMLADFGIKTEYENDVLTVIGGEHMACRAESFGDHRMAMSAAVCALNTDGESVIEGVECMAKSYPAFLEHARMLGADITECTGS